MVLLFLPLCEDLECILFIFGMHSVYNSIAYYILKYLFCICCWLKLHTIITVLHIV